MTSPSKVVTTVFQLTIISPALFTAQVERLPLRARQNPRGGEAFGGHRPGESETLAYDVVGSPSTSRRKAASTGRQYS